MTPSTPDAPHRRYEVRCPSCGAPVAFRSAQSDCAVCSFCRSTVARSGDVLRRVGRMSELFDDHSPLQLLAEGQIPAFAGEAARAAHAPPPPAGARFTLIGRVQWQSATGRWTEWEALLSNGQRTTLSEDQGRYVMTWPLPAGVELPRLDALRVEQTVTIEGRPFTVTAVLKAAVHSAEGELPKLPPTGFDIPWVELRSPDGVVVTLEGPDHPPRASWGRSVELADLKLRGLRQEPSTRQDEGRRFSCPHCGSAVSVKLRLTKRVTCPSCRSVLELDPGQGVGAEVLQAQQRQHVTPKVALGSMGQFEGLPWQVVGFQRRGGSSDGEAFHWDEYLLYHPEKGFQFLVDTADGWSLAKTLPGTPRTLGGDQVAMLHGHSYHLHERYESVVQYVEGEFYWPVQVGERTEHSDYRLLQNSLTRERTAQEVTWSLGRHMTAAAVAAAFGRSQDAALFGPPEVGVTTASTKVWSFAAFLIFLIVLIVLFSQQDDEGTGGGRTSGGSYGGFSTGGFHK